MACGPVATSVFLRWRVDSVPATLDGRLSTSKPAGVRASPLYRRTARSRSAEVVDGALETGGVGTLAGWLLPDEEGAGAPPPPPPQAETSSEIAARMKAFRRFMDSPCRIVCARSFIVSIVTRSYVLFWGRRQHTSTCERGGPSVGCTSPRAAAS